MKTTSFSSIDVVFSEGTTDIGIIMKVPGEGTMSTKVTPEELMILMVEMGNGLSGARKAEVIQRQKIELQREQRRSE